MKTKLPHYTLPAFPCVALWLALQIRHEENSFAWFGKRFVTLMFFIFALTLGGFSVAKNYLLTENLWCTVAPQVRADTKVACLGYTEPSLVWKFRGVTTNLVQLGDVSLAQDFLTNAPPLILVLPARDAAQLATMKTDRQFSVHGLDLVKFKNRDLTAIVRE